MTKEIFSVKHVMPPICYLKKEKYKNYPNNVQFVSFKFYQFTIKKRIRANTQYVLIAIQIPKESISYLAFFVNLKPVNLVGHL